MHLFCPNDEGMKMKWSLHKLVITRNFHIPYESICCAFVIFASGPKFLCRRFWASSTQ